MVLPQAISCFKPTTALYHSAHDQENCSLESGCCKYQVLLTITGPDFKKNTDCFGRSLSGIPQRHLDPDEFYFKKSTDFKETLTYNRAGSNTVNPARPRIRENLLYKPVHYRSEKAYIFSPGDADGNFSWPGAVPVPPYPVPG